jgi:hypothetical protein
MADVSRGDIVTRDGLSFVVWEHGQGEIQAMPVDETGVNWRRVSRLSLDSVVNTGETLGFPEKQRLKSLRATHLQRESATIRPDGWDRFDDPDPVFFGGDRPKVSLYDSENCYWIPACKGAE